MRRRSDDPCRGLTRLIAGSTALAAFSYVSRASADEKYKIDVPRLAQAPVIDGRLDDEAWKIAALASDFTQIQPYDGKPATERTEVRIGYDAETLYVAFRCFSADPAGIRAAAMNRDASLESEEHVELALDTYHNRQNGFLFLTNPNAARVDGTIRDDGEDVRWDWDGQWTVATTRDASGWSAELAIPFATLRYTDSSDIVFGVNFARYSSRKHELAFWKPLHLDRGIVSSRYKVSDYGELGGFTGLRSPNLFELKPYVLLGGSSIGGSGPIRLTQGGLDVKVPITSSLVANFTVNPDFADAEADAQQVNLTRFPLLLPEKREFFKDNAELFYFGDRVVESSNETFEQFNLFQSRKIGLAKEGQVTVPVIGGARLTGRVGQLSIGAMNLTTPEVATTVKAPLYNYSVLRLKYELPGGSSFGVMDLNKEGGDGSYNRALGVDANAVLTKNLRFGGYVARTLTSDVHGSDLAGSADVLWQSDLLGFRALYTDIGDDFRPEMGYLTRAGIRKFQIVPSLIFKPTFIPTKHVDFVYDYNQVMDHAGNLQTRLQTAEVLTFFNNGWALGLVGYEELETIGVPFKIYPGAEIPAGTYEFKSAFLGIASDQDVPVAGLLWLQAGQFWGGNRQRVRFVGTVRPRDGMVLQGIYDVQVVELPWGSFVAHLASFAATYALTPAVSSRATVQFASDSQVRTNVLLSWNYAPGANVYFIVNDQRDLLGGRPWLENLMVALKVNYTWGMPRPTGPSTRAISNPFAQHE